MLIFSALPLLAQQRVTENFSATPLEEVFQVFGDKYGLLLAFDPAIVRGKSVSIHLQEEEVVRSFYQILAQSGLEYLTISEGQILIRPKVVSELAPALTYYQLNGHIKDETTGEPLAYATVFSPQLNKGTVTDEAGNFRFSCPDTIKGDLWLEARYLGYKPQQLKVGKATQAVFTLAALPQSIGAVIIVTDEAATLGLAPGEQAMVIRPNDKLPSLGGATDVLRNLQLLPGVAAFNDGSAALQVRGGNAEENLLLWDGMLLYGVDHFFGAFSAVNGALVSSVKLYKNTYPISYGGRTSSVVVMDSYPMTTAHHATQIELSSLLANASTRLKLTNNMELQIGGRSSLNNLAKNDLFGVLNQEVDLGNGNLLDLIEESRQIQVQPAYRFYDANVKWAWQASEKTYFDFNAYRSEDHYDYDYDLAFRTRNQGRLITNTTRFRENSDWANAAYSFRWQQVWSESWRSELTLGYSSFSIAEITSTELIREQLNGDFLFLINENTRNNDLEGWRFNWSHDYQLDDQQKIAFGLQGSQEAVSLQIAANNTATLLANDGREDQLGLFASYQWEKTKWLLEAGLHATYYSATAAVYPSPRFQFGYQANDAWRLKGAVNHYYQFLRRYYHENRYGRNFEIWTLADGEQFPVGNSTQGMLGFTFRKGDFLLDAEAYYKHSNGVLEHTTVLNEFSGPGGVANGNAFYQVSQGTGKVVGLDLLISQRWSHYSTWLAYTLSRSRRTFNELFRGASYAAQDDRPHQLQWVNEYEYQRWSLSGVYIFASGRPYLDLAVSDLANDRRERNVSSLRRIPAYHRVDVSARYTYPMEKGEVYGSLGVFNLLDRANTLYRQRIYSLPEENNRNVLLGNELQLLGRTVSVAVGVKF
ncbi:carboxypeptidase-like regulatory domain-containing protein [Lewinella sp. LCG006]|uniref:carboxypeptidase-like regulatory domain-containing protein n=1 Tax=Lewinella sp. LCG006 TaxID=3231911 RepID=UPI003460494F